MSENTYEARTYGRDGDNYGRHALIVPGGNNTQRDVLHVIPTRYRDRYRIHPTRFDPDYVGAHRVTGLRAALAAVLSR